MFLIYHINYSNIVISFCIPCVFLNLTASLFQYMLLKSSNVYTYICYIEYITNIEYISLLKVRLVMWNLINKYIIDPMGVDTVMINNNKTVDYTLVKT